MPYYVSQWDGDGTNDTPFTPNAAANVVTDTAWSCIDLRGDATQASGWCLFWTEQPLTSVPGGVIHIVDSEDDALTVQEINWINTNFGVPLANGTSFKQAVRAIMLDGDFNDPGRWNPLTKGNKGKFEIYLGNLYDEFD
jgi:hypothetical protein